MTEQYPQWIYDLAFDIVHAIEADFVPNLLDLQTESKNDFALCLCRKISKAVSRGGRSAHAARLRGNDAVK